MNPSGEIGGRVIIVDSIITLTLDRTLIMVMFLVLSQRPRCSMAEVLISDSEDSLYYY